MIPVLDALSGKSTREADLDAPRLSFHDRVLELWVPTQLGLLAWTIYSLSTRPATQAELIGITISMGLLSGAVGINIAHALMHRKERAHRALAEILMTSVGYAHYCIEHVFGHHMNVGKHDDPVTARKGESVYAFLPRAIFTGMTSAWRLEKKRCERAGIHGLNLRDRRQRYSLTQLIFFATIYFSFGPLITGFCLSLIHI